MKRSLHESWQCNANQLNVWFCLSISWKLHFKRSKQRGRRKNVRTWQHWRHIHINTHTHRCVEFAYGDQFLFFSFSCWCRYAAAASSCNTLFYIMATIHKLKLNVLKALILVCGAFFSLWLTWFTLRARRSSSILFSIAAALVCFVFFGCLLCGCLFSFSLQFSLCFSSIFVRLFCFTKNRARTKGKKDSHSHTRTQQHARSHTLTHTDAALRIFLFLLLLSVFSMPPPLAFRRFFCRRAKSWEGEVEN